MQIVCKTYLQFNQIMLQTLNFHNNPVTYISIVVLSFWLPETNKREYNLNIVLRKIGFKIRKWVLVCGHRQIIHFKKYVKTQLLQFQVLIQCFSTFFLLRHPYWIIVVIGCFPMVKNIKYIYFAIGVPPNNVIPQQG